MVKKIKYQVELPKYEEGEWLRIPWEEKNEKVYVELDESNNKAILIANHDGLKSLAHIMLTLAQETVQDGRNLHFYSEEGELEEGSSNLFIMRMVDQ